MEMSETLAEFLTAEDADASTLQHAVRFLTGELSGDLPRQAQREQLARAAGDEAAVDQALAVLERDSAVLLEADLAVLAALWDDPEHRERVRAAVRGAKAKLPVVETAVITTAAMYGLYLVVTGGKKKTTRKVVRRPDGSYEATETTEFHNPTGPLKALSAILGRLVP
jgi:hypothetical protein